MKNEKKIRLKLDVVSTLFMPPSYLCYSGIFHGETPTTKQRPSEQWHFSVSA